MATDAPLRRDVRLLGDLLGRVMVEQEGEELLESEEEIRRVSRRARETGDPDVRAELARAVGELDLEQQTKILRAFALFFQLANIAEQQHRVRRRRDVEREGGVPRESLAEAFRRLRESGVDAAALARAADHVSLELVLTAHPTEATRRTILQAQARARRAAGGARRRRGRRGARAPRRSPSSGRRTRCAHSARGSSTRCVTASGSSSTACSTLPRSCSAHTANPSRARRCPSPSEAGSGATWTETRTPGPRRSARHWNAAARWRSPATEPRYVSSRRRSA